MRRPDHHDLLLGFRLFSDGLTRPVFQDKDGDQYLLHEDQGRIYGLWLSPDLEPDKPVVAENSEPNR
jgi:hypothetical protein